jgi:hypothetical protein
MGWGSRRPNSGGRRPGAGRKKATVTAEIREIARQYGPEAIAELARLAKHALSEQARVAAIKNYLTVATAARCSRLWARWSTEYRSSWRLCPLATKATRWVPRSRVALRCRLRTASALMGLCRLWCPRKKPPFGLSPPFNPSIPPWCILGIQLSTIHAATSCVRSNATSPPERTTCLGCLSRSVRPTHAPSRQLHRACGRQEGEAWKGLARYAPALLRLLPPTKAMI